MTGMLEKYATISLFIFYWLNFYYFQTRTFVTGNIIINEFIIISTHGTSYPQTSILILDP